jgi:chromosome segregation ATPase
MKTEAIRYCIQAQFGKEDYAEARLELTALETKINRLTAFNESMQTDADRASLRIIAKDMQIAELTRMLFALGKQDGQTIRNLTAEIARLAEKVRYAYVQIEALERAK